MGEPTQNNSSGEANGMASWMTFLDMRKKATEKIDVALVGKYDLQDAYKSILESLDHAQARGARIYAEVVGVGMSADIYNIVAPDPEGAAAVKSMEGALRSADLRPEDVDYINTHGTSTQLGDLSECRAIAKVFGDHAPKLAINSTKSMIGHLLGAGSAVESVAIFCSMRDNLVHPTINLEHLDPLIPSNWNFVPGEAISREVKVVMTNSFGFGGHNVSLLYKKFEE
jgi:3-oxoacyl-[acyl-carrier-protein] synthase II